MRINILVNEVGTGWEPTDTRLGGTEESVVRWAGELNKRGHEAHVYRNGRGKRHPKNYHERWEYEGGGDICINIKSSDIPPKEPTLYLTNETDADKLDLSAYLGVIWPSQWAVDNIPVNNKTYILPHGYDPKRIYPERKIRKQCLYASSPDRGLDELLKAWKDVYKAHPDATLIVTYGAPHRYIEGVFFTGEIDEEMMDELYRTSEYWCHPCTGGELFGITGVKAQAAGCWPVIVPTMALAETVKFGTFSNHTNYAQDLIEALHEVPKVPQIHFVNWTESTDILLEIIEKSLKK